MESVKVLTRCSNAMARQSVVSLDAALRDRMVRDVAAKIDAQLFSATGDGITLPKGMTQDGVFRLFGAPVTITSRLPLDGESQASVVMADFSQIAVARDVAPSVMVLDQTFGDYDLQAIRVVARYDASPLNPEAVVKLTNITI